MVPLGIDHQEGVPLHEQVAAELRRDISEGHATPGQRLPPARDIAAALGVHPNTVFRALRVFRDQASSSSDVAGASRCLQPLNNRGSSPRLVN